MEKVLKKIAFVILPIIFAVVCLAWADDFSDFIKKGDAFWKNRSDPAECEKAIGAYTAALDINPKSPLALQSLAKAYFWRGEYLKEKSRKEQGASYRQGFEYADILCKLDPQNEAGNYWFAVNEAYYIHLRGIKKHSKLIVDVKKHLLLVSQKNKSYDNGGPARLWAQVILWSPDSLRKSFGASLKEAESLLKEAIGQQSNFLLNHLLLADVYHQMKKPNAQKNKLQFVLKADPTALSGYEPENRRAQMIAKQKLKEYFGK